MENKKGCSKMRFNITASQNNTSASKRTVWPTFRGVAIATDSHFDNKYTLQLIS